MFMLINYVNFLNHKFESTRHLVKHFIRNNKYSYCIKAGRRFHTPTPSLRTLWTPEYIHD